jgi:hypothetical protein
MRTALLKVEEIHVKAFKTREKSWDFGIFKMLLRNL